MANKTAQQNTEKTVKASATNLRIAPRKLRLVANSVKGMPVAAALQHLSFLNKKGASMVAKVVSSAVANAEHNFSLVPETLYIQAITCDQGRVLGRYMPRARGSSSPLNRKMSHLNVTLGVKESLARKVKTSRLAGILRRSKNGESKSAAPEIEVPVTEEKAQSKGVQAKSAEKIKQNRVQQKRRLFNRKSGE
jgi:large subunit ribosomal protein L22